MNRKLMLLQIFADEEPTETVEEPTKEEPGDGEPEKKYSETEIDELLKRKFAEWERKRDKKEKEESEARRLAKMNDEEREREENERMKKRMQELLDKEALSDMAGEARRMLSEKNIRVSDDLIKRIISKDADETKKSVESFAAAFQSAVNSAVKDALKGEAPKAGVKPATMTREEIMKIQNRSERLKAIKEHMDLFS